MDKDKQGTGVLPEQLMALAEHAKTVNLYAGLGPAGQQIFLDKLISVRSPEQQQKLIEELTK